MQKRSAPDFIDASLAGLPHYLTRREAAELLRCKPDFISKLVKTGELAAVQRKPKPGHTRRGIPLKISRESLRAYLEACAR